MQVSIIIPTYNRAIDLDACFNSIIIQTMLPEEIVIVDDSDNDEIEVLAKKREKEFKNADVELKYIKNDGEKSLTIARNIGLKYVKGDIVLFLDSDVILEKDYISEILKIYNKNSDAIGVQGYITNTIKPSKKYMFIRKLLFLGRPEKNKCRVLSNSDTTYPYYIDKIIQCEWLSGSNQSYKKEIFNEFKYDEKLRRYSFMEDVDFSYRVNKKYPNSLYMTPYAKLIHNVSEAGRVPRKKLIAMRQIYNHYFFYKNINQSFRNKLNFIITKFTQLIFNFIEPSTHRLTQFKFMIIAYVSCFKHLKEIKEGDLDFFNI